MTGRGRCATCHSRTVTPLCCNFPAAPEGKGAFLPIDERGRKTSVGFGRRGAKPKLAGVELENEFGGILGATKNRGVEGSPMFDMAFRLTGSRGPPGPELPKTVTAIPMRHPRFSHPSMTEAK